MTENRWNTFSAHFTRSPQSSILIDSECLSVRPRRHAIPHLQDHNHPHYEVLLSCLSVNMPSDWLTSVTRTSDWPAPGLTCSVLESLGHRESLCSVFSHNNNFLNRNIPPRPGSGPSPPLILSSVDFFITEFLQIDLRPSRICNLVNFLQLVFITWKYGTWNERSREPRSQKPSLKEVWLWTLCFNEDMECYN